MFRRTRCEIWRALVASTNRHRRRCRDLEETNVREETSLAWCPHLNLMHSSLRNEMVVQIDSPFVRRASEEADSSMKSLEVEEISFIVRDIFPLYLHSHHRQFRPMRWLMHWLMTSEERKSDPGE